MASVANVPYILGLPTPHHKPHNNNNNNNKFKFLCRQFLLHRNIWWGSSNTVTYLSQRTPKRISSTITCFAANKPSPSTEISSTARIRSEVLTPFRSVRMFFYLAFIASASLGGLIATTQLIAALTNSSKAAGIPDILNGLGIDIGAVSLFAFLYYRENNAKNLQLARLSREENLSNLKLRVDQKRIIPVSSFRGIARLVICAGPASFIMESFRQSEPFTESLVDRGVLVVPFAIDGSLPSFEFEENEETKEITSKRKRLWQLAPVNISEWSKWLDEQKKLAGVTSESPVYLSLRMDGRVRGSGVGYPPWNAFVAQLPPVKGIWSGILDGMDGRFVEYILTYSDMLPPFKQKLSDIGNGANLGEKVLAISAFNLYICLLCQFSCSSTAELASFSQQPYSHTRLTHDLMGKLRTALQEAEFTNSNLPFPSSKAKTYKNK
ncbi:protein LOW PSII ACCUMULATION 1, chloroplastic [Fagus crenata]